MLKRKDLFYVASKDRRDKRVSLIRRQISIQNRGAFQTRVLSMMQEDVSPGVSPGSAFE